MCQWYHRHGTLRDVREATCGGEMGAQGKHMPLFDTGHITAIPHGVSHAGHGILLLCLVYSGQWMRETAVRSTGFAHRVSHAIPAVESPFSAVREMRPAGGMRYWGGRRQDHCRHCAVVSHPDDAGRRRHGARQGRLTGGGLT